MSYRLESHPIGTARELLLSRNLARAIEQLMIQYGPNIIPFSIREPYFVLKSEYDKQLQNEESHG